MGYMGGTGWGWGMGGLTMILVWGVIIVAVVWAVREFGRGNRGSLPRTPLDTLKDRYARGEIDKDEFEQKKRDLGG